MSSTKLHKFIVPQLCPKTHLFVKVISPPNLQSLSIHYTDDFRPLSIYFSDLCDLRQVLCKSFLTHSDYAIFRTTLYVLRTITQLGLHKIFFSKQDANLRSMTSNLEDTVKYAPSSQYGVFNIVHKRACIIIIQYVYQHRICITIRHVSTQIPSSS